MTNNDVSKLVLSREAFGDDLWNVVGEQLKILTREGYICVVYDDDIDIIVIQYEYRDKHDSIYYGLPQPVWLNEDEQEVIESYRDQKAHEKTDEDEKGSD